MSDFTSASGCFPHRREESGVSDHWEQEAWEPEEGTNGCLQEADEAHWSLQATKGNVYLSAQCVHSTYTRHLSKNHDIVYLKFKKTKELFLSRGFRWNPESLVPEIENIYEKNNLQAQK